MPDTLADSPLPDPVAPPRKRGLAWLAWGVILLVVAFEVFGPRLLQRLRPNPRRAADKDRIDTLLTELQVRYIVGAAELTGGGKALFAQANSLNTGPIDQRLPYVVLAGDMEGPGEALEQIDRLKGQLAEQHVEADPEQLAVLDSLGRLYRDRKDGTDTLTDTDRDLLRDRLGWTGRLALTPPDDPDTEARRQVVRPAKRLAVTLIAAFAAGGALGLLGLAWLIVWAVLYFMGRLRPGLPPPTRHGGIYAEAFAVYMVVFLGLSIGHHLLKVPGPDLLLSAAGMLISLGAGLGWPVLRGVPWRQVRQEVGLTLGRRPWLEPIVGLGGYAMVLPIFGVGIIVSSVLIQYERRAQVGDRPEEHFAPVEQPSHPIVEWLQNPDWSLLAQVVLIACVLAPLVEETMFRGALYRHLRNATAGFGRAGSFLVSAVVVSFLFAVIHPQGVLAVPALMSLALGLTVLREWRGSLLPSMMVHGIHNGLTTFVLVQALRGQPMSDWTHSYAVVNGVRLHCVEAGDGPPVILLHGFPEFWYAWRHQLPALAAAGFRALAPDLRGYNLSDKPPGVASYRLDHLVGDVAGLIRDTGRPRAAVVGHDWGGAIAWALAMRHPELVERLVVLNAPHPAAFLRELRTPAQLLRSWYIFFFQLPGLPEWALRRGEFALLERTLRRDPVRPGAFTDEDVRLYKEALGRPGALTAALNYYRAVFRGGLRRARKDVRPVTVPALLLWGEQDRYLGRRLTEGLEPWVPNLRVERFADASHWLHAEWPERVNRLIIDFLRG